MNPLAKIAFNMVMKQLFKKFDLNKINKYVNEDNELDDAMKKLAEEVSNNPFQVTPETKNKKNKKKQKVKPPCRINHKSTRCARYGTTKPESCMVSEKGWCKKKKQVSEDSLDICVHCQQCALIVEKRSIFSKCCPWF